MENEAVSHQINHAPAIAAFYEQNDALKDPTLRREYFASMQADGFLDLLQQVNSIVRTGDDTKRQPFDGHDVALEGHNVPDDKDKEQLLRETWDVARSFLADKKLDDEDALAYAGLTVAGGVLLTHPFMDSNGRSSRVASHMIISGRTENTESELEQLLSKDGNSAWLVMPLENATAVYTNFPFKGSKALPADSYEIDWGEEDYKEIGVIKNPSDPADKMAEERFKTRALHQFALHADETAHQVLRQYTEFDGAGKPAHLDARAALRALVSMPDKGIGYAAQLLEAAQWTRADYVRRYLRSMQIETPVKSFRDLNRDLQSLSELAARDPEAIPRLKALSRFLIEDKITPRDHARVNLAASKIIMSREAPSKSPGPKVLISSK